MPALTFDLKGKDVIIYLFVIIILDACDSRLKSQYIIFIQHYKILQFVTQTNLLLTCFESP